ncbi:unnamed protein product [Laminaria digitata]
MDIDAEVVGWVIGKNGSTIKDMKHKTGCNMWVDQRALKLTITGPDLSSVEHAAKTVDAYVAAAPIKAGAVEAAVTKTLECPPHLLDILGDRTTIARIVKETHAQVVVNKKIARIIVRGDHRSVELAYANVQTTMHSAMNSVLGLRVSTPESLGSHGGGGAGYFAGGGGGGGGGGASSGGGRSTGGLSPLEGLGGGGGASVGMHMLPPSHVPTFRTTDISDYRGVPAWQQLQQQPDLQNHHHHPHQQPRGGGDGRGGSDSDDSEIETVSLGSIGVRTPVSSTAGSPRAVASYNTSPTLSGTASTPGGDWSLFSGGFGLGMAALQEGSSCASTPTTSRATPRVHFPQGLQALAGNDPVLGSVASADDVDTQGDGEEEDGKDVEGGGVRKAGGGVGSHAPPPSPASTTSGEATRKMRTGLIVDQHVLNSLEGTSSEDGEGEEGDDGGEDIADKVARLGRRLQSMGLGKYCSKFAENEVDLESLGLMTEGDLADIGIPKGPRLKILNAVGARGAGGGAASSTSSA